MSSSARMDARRCDPCTGSGYDCSCHPTNPKRIEDLFASHYRVADRLSRDIPIHATHGATLPILRGRPRRRDFGSGASISRRSEATEIIVLRRSLVTSIRPSEIS